MPDQGGLGPVSVVLEDILSCPSLPTLPAVAVEVIELTQNADVSMDDLARTIQNDQALAAKILRTVNSSFYGLSKPVSSINQAIVLLGLSTVKSLALGFSLVQAQDGGDESSGFDHAAYWRRGLFTAVSAQRIAEEAKASYADEAFLGGLLQDIGQMAMFTALGDRYVHVLERCEGDHNALAAFELQAFEVQHTEVGAMLARRWKLPDALVVPVRYHERPTAAPPEHAGLVRCVALGNLAHDVLTDADPGPAMMRFTQQALKWFGFKPNQVEEMLKTIASDTAELSGLFQLNTGEAPQADQILEQANARLIELTRAAPVSSADGELASLLLDGDRVDPISGALRAELYVRALRENFARASTGGDAMSVVKVRIDSLEGTIARYGEEAGDLVLVGTTALLRKHFEPLGGTVCRLGLDTFGIVIGGTGRLASVRAAAEFRADLQRVSHTWNRDNPGEPMDVLVSVGTAFMDSSEGCTFSRLEQLEMAASKALKAAADAGGNSVRTFIPASKAA